MMEVVRQLVVKAWVIYKRCLFIFVTNWNKSIDVWERTSATSAGVPKFGLKVHSVSNVKGVWQKK